MRNLDKSILQKKLNDSNWQKALIEIRKELRTSSDRGIVLICGSVLEGLLEELLKGFFIEANKTEEDLFKGKGALSNFDGKIHLSFYLGLITKNEFENLKFLQNVRNIFAHQVYDISFENNRIINISKNFKIPKNSFMPIEMPSQNIDSSEFPKVDLNPINRDTPAKNRFLFTFYYLFSNFTRKVSLVRLEKRKELTITLTADEYMQEGINKQIMLMKRFREAINNKRELYEKIDFQKSYLANKQSEADINLLKELEQEIAADEKEYEAFKEAGDEILKGQSYLIAVLKNSLID